MAFRTIRAERKLDHQFIEREGKVFMDRMAEEKERKEQVREG